MIMSVGSPYSSFLEFNFYHHNLTVVSHNLSGYTFITGLFPFCLVFEHEWLAASFVTRNLRILFCTVVCVGCITG